MNLKKATVCWMVWWDIPSDKETEVTKFPHQEKVDNFFGSQGLVNKEFLPEGKTLNAEFYKGSAFSGFVQLRSGLEIFTCCTIMRPPTKLQLFVNFLPPKMLQPFIRPRNLQIYLRQNISLPHIKNGFKRTPFCGCCWDPRICDWWI